MKSKFISVLLLFTMLVLFAVPCSVSAEESVTTPPAIRVVLNGTELAFDVPPQIIDGRTMVPMRAIFEAFGAEVLWNDAEKTITATKDTTVITLKIGNTTLQKGYRTITLDVPPQIVENRTLVPVRAIAESFGAEVLWDAETKTVKITTDPSLSNSPCIFYDSSNARKLICSRDKDWFIALNPAFQTKSVQNGTYCFLFNMIMNATLFINIEKTEDTSFLLENYAKNQFKDILESNKNKSDPVVEEIKKVKINHLDYYSFVVKGTEQYSDDFAADIYDYYYYTVWNNTIFSFDFQQYENTFPQLLYETLDTFNPTADKAKTEAIITKYLSDPTSDLKAVPEPNSDPSSPTFADSSFILSDTLKLPKLLYSVKKDWYITADASYQTGLTSVQGAYCFFKFGDKEDILSMQITDVPKDETFDLKNAEQKKLDETVITFNGGRTNAMEKSIAPVSINGLDYFTYVVKTTRQGIDIALYSYIYATVFDNKLFEFCGTTYNNAPSQTLLDTLQSFNPKADKADTERFINNYLSDTEKARKDLIYLKLSEVPYVYTEGTDTTPQLVTPPLKNWTISVDNNYSKIGEDPGVFSFQLGNMTQSMWLQSDAVDLPMFSFRWKDSGESIILMMYQDSGEKKELSKISNFVKEGRFQMTKQLGGTNNIVKESSAETINGLPFQTYSVQTVYPDTDLTYYTTSYLTEWDGVYYEFISYGTASTPSEAFMNTVRSFQP